MQIVGSIGSGPMSVIVPTVVVLIGVGVALFGPWIVARIWIAGHGWTLALWSVIVAATLRSTSISSLQTPLWDVVLFCGLLCLGLISIFSSRKRVEMRDSRLIPIAVLLLIVGYALILNIALNDWRYIARIGLFLFVLFALVPSYLFRWRNSEVISQDLRSTFQVLTLLVAISLTLGTIGDPEAFGYNDRLQGVWANPNYLGPICALTAIYGVSKLWFQSAQLARIFAWTTTLTGVAGVVWSGSRGSAAAAAVGIVVVSFPALKHQGRAWKIVLGLTAIFAVGIAFSGYVRSFLSRSQVNTDFSSGRTELWGRLLDEATVFGAGLYTTTPDVSIEEVNASGGLIIQDLAPHNIFLQVLVEIGVIGLGIFVCFLLVVMRSRMKVPPYETLLGIVLAIFVYELTESSLFGFGGPFALVAWLCILMLASASRLTRTTQLEVEASANSPAISASIAMYSRRERQAAAASDLLPVGNQPVASTWEFGVARHD